ncbi:hypothetical protein JCM10213v2_008273 [Rhodosporidiobolus nylandii]
MDEVILLEGESGRAKVLLPPELLLPILSLAVEDEPPPSRYAILHHLCLVSHIFREIAQPLLFRCIQPATPEAWEKLAALIESHPHVRQHVRAARIGEWHAGRRWNLWCPTIDIRCLRLLPILWRIPWQSFVDYMSPWRDFPSSPISLKHLHILPITYPPPPHYLCELSRCELSRRLASDPSLSTLEVLYLPTQWKGAGTEEGKEEWERVLKEKNVEVEYEDVEPFWEHEGGGMLRAFERRCEAAAGEVSEVVN